MMNDPRANPLALGPLQTRQDLQRAVVDLYEPLLPYASETGACIRLGSHAAVFTERVAELEGFARPLYGIVPLTVGGGDFAYWDRFVSGLDAGTDPTSPDYWGAIDSHTDQRMVEQAAIGLALAFCPEKCWEPLSPAAKDNVAAWLYGIFEFDPADNNWQFFRILTALGLERVGRPFDVDKLNESHAKIESYRRGESWYRDTVIENVDYYIPFAFHTYGLMYVAANKLGLGSDDHAKNFASRAAGFASDFATWFAPDGASIPYGRSLTYRFAMASFWGSLAWADVEAMPWGQVKGLAMRHLRWWADKPISDRDGVLSIGFSYDNRRMAEGYNSAGSPYWSMKYFSGLAAPADHPFWTSDEEPLPEQEKPVTLVEPGWVVDRDDSQAVALVGHRGFPGSFMEQSGAKYHKFAYSSAFGFSGDVETGSTPSATDSVLTLIDAAGARRNHFAPSLGGVEDGLAWTIWFPWPDVRVETVLWGGAPWHGRIHTVHTEQTLKAQESGFAILSPSAEITSRIADGHGSTTTDHESQIISPAGSSYISDRSGERRAKVWSLPVNANIIAPKADVPILLSTLEPGDHRLECVVFASPGADLAGEQPEQPETPTKAIELLERLATTDAEPWPSAENLMKMFRK